MDLKRRRVCELLLDKVEVEVAGAGRRKKGVHMVMTRLVWPRTAIAERVAVKTVSLENNAADLTEAGWTERVLFKETVQGPFGLEVGVSERLAEGAVAAFMKSACAWLVEVSKAGVNSLLEDGVPGGFLKLPFEHVWERLSDGDKEPAMIARGCMDVDLPGGLKAGRRVRLDVPLTNPETIFRIERRRKHGELSTRKRKVLEAGRPNGRAVISARVYG